MVQGVIAAAVKIQKKYSCSGIFFNWDYGKETQIQCCRQRESLVDCKRTLFSGGCMSMVKRSYACLRKSIQMVMGYVDMPRLSGISFRFKELPDANL